jgi:aldehyde:ferredoxin oxidoreductase
MKGVNGKILIADLTAGTTHTRMLSEKDYKLYLGGRGLGMKLLSEYLDVHGTDPLGPENPLMFMPGLMCGFPFPSSSRTCMVTKSPITRPLSPAHRYASTVSYSNMGGFIGPEIKFAGYDGIVVTGSSDKPVYLFVENDRVEIRNASKFSGMTSAIFDEAIIKEVGDRRFESAYIGPGAERGVLYGSNKPEVADPAMFSELLKEARLSFGADSESKTNWRYGGTANALQFSSDRGSQAVKNFSEGTFSGIEKINAHAARSRVWKRDMACFTCHLACKKSGFAKGAYGGVVNEGIEYETGTMLGANLLIDDLDGLHKMIEIADDYGIDIITLGNVLGFLMECYEKKLIDIDFLDGIALHWGSVNPCIEMIHKIGTMEGVGAEAAKGVRHLSELIGKNSSEFAIHVKGHELAAWNVQGYAKSIGISYTTANRGACHMTGGDIGGQNLSTLRDSLGMCSFAASWYRKEIHFKHIIKAITGFDLTEEEFMETGERIFNLERWLNSKEGFGREDDCLPERFFKDAYTEGPQKNVVLDRSEFSTIMDGYYTNRGWNLNTGVPEKATLERLKII